jgi:chromosome segregation ATPase/ribosomal protein L37AE/L43A
MNESATHFISVCPHCSASVRINRGVIGHDVVCKHCRGTFLADASKEAIPLSSPEDRAGPSIELPDQAERIVVNCPNCQATLRVRRVYLGKPVVCKQCNHTFPVRDPAQRETEAAASDSGTISKASLPQIEIESTSPATAGEYDRLRSEHDRLLGEHKQLQEESSHHAAKYAHYKLQYKQAFEELGRVTADLDRIRGHLGTVAPEDIQGIKEERESLRAEVNGLRDSNRVLSAENAARAHVAAELERRESESATVRAEREALEQQLRQRHDELNSIRAERESLSQQLKQRGDELAAAGAEHDRLSIQLREVLSEVDQSRATLADRDHAFRDENDKLRGEVENLRQALATAEQNHRADLDRLNEQFLRASEQGNERDVLRGEKDRLLAEVEGLRGALERADITHRAERDRIHAELAALSDQHRQLRDEQESAVELSKQHEERNQALVEAHEKLKSDYRLMLDAAETRSEQGDPAPASPALSAELESLRRQVADLNRRLAVADREHRDLVQMLDSIGIRPGWAPEDW